MTNMARTTGAACSHSRHHRPCGARCGATLTDAMQTAVNRMWHRLRTLGVLVAAGLAVVVAALLYSTLLSPRSGLYLGAAALAGLITYRWPAASMAIAFAMSGSYGSLKAFFGYPANGTATVLLVGMTVATVGALIFARRRRPIVIWPATVAVAVYVLAVAADLPFSPVFSSALKVARTEGLYMVGMLVIAYGPWREGTHGRA